MKQHYVKDSHGNRCHKLAEAQRRRLLRKICNAGGEGLSQQVPRKQWLNSSRPEREAVADHSEAVVGEGSADPYSKPNAATAARKDGPARKESAEERSETADRKGPKETK